MFRSKRSALVKRLWKLKVPTESSKSVGGDHDEAGCTLESYSCNLEVNVKAVAYSMLKRLKEVQLEAMLRAVESKGADLSDDCVLVPKGDLRITGLGSIPPNLLCCQLWRWPDLNVDSHLKQLPCCRSINDPLYICCNPYHWSKLHFTESPPPPYSKYSMELKSSEYFADIPDSTHLNNDGYINGSLNSYNSGVHDVPIEESNTYDSEFNSPRDVWCKVAYWEMETRVGRLFSVTSPYLPIFGDVPLGDGLCLGSLSHLNRTKNDSVIRTRYKIGLGVIIFKEDEKVWLYNRSDYQLFVSSPTMDLPNTRTLMVHKIMPGCSVNVFDFEKAKRYKNLHNPELFDGPVDRNFVRVSFAKGWGSKYSRQFVTCCPCSLEILMSSKFR